MILHYLKMAWRNLLHYRAQAVISVAGLAAGFVCFTLANLWRVYETTYDTSYEGADRMYVCCMKTDFMESGYFDYNVYPLATWLKTTCPEVEQAAAIDARLAEMDLRAEDGTAVKGKAVMADSCFLQLFGIQILKGTDDFLRGGDRVALTESMARRLYGTTDVLGRKLTYQNTQATVCALAASAFLHYGPGSFEFSVSFILAMVVMYDATGVRQETGKQAKVLNALLRENPFEWTGELLEQRLKEFVGHTPLQVFAGAVLGILVALAAEFLF